MGTVHLQGLPHFFSPGLTPFRAALPANTSHGAPTSGRLQRGPKHHPVGSRNRTPSFPRQKRVDNPLCSAARQIDDAFDAVVYRSQVERAAVALRFQEFAGRFGRASGDQTQEVQVGLQQLTFDFFAETRTEELLLFRQRTDAVAEDLDGTRRETFIEASRRVSARFEFSMSISGAALNGFAGAGEGLQEADGATFDRFLGLAADVLDKIDEMLK